MATPPPALATPAPAPAPPQLITLPPPPNDARVVRPLQPSIPPSKSDIFEAVAYRRAVDASASMYSSGVSLVPPANLLAILS